STGRPLIPPRALMSSSTTLAPLRSLIPNGAAGPVSEKSRPTRRASASPEESASPAAQAVVTSTAVAATPASVARIQGDSRFISILTETVEEPCFHVDGQTLK